MFTSSWCKLPWPTPMRPISATKAGHVSPILSKRHDYNTLSDSSSNNDEDADAAVFSKGDSPSMCPVNTRQEEQRYANTPPISQVEPSITARRCLQRQWRTNITDTTMTIDDEDAVKWIMMRHLSEPVLFWTKWPSLQNPCFWIWSSTVETYKVTESVEVSKENRSSRYITIYATDGVNALPMPMLTKDEIFFTMEWWNPQLVKYRSNWFEWKYHCTGEIH